MNNAFKALADPTRRQILQILNNGEQSAGEIAKKFNLASATMSHHFNNLKEAGLISQRRDGQTIYYRLEATVIQEVISSLLEFSDSHLTQNSNSDKSIKNAKVAIK